MPHKSHHHRVLSRIFYSHYCATYRRNIWYAPPGKFRFKFLRNALQQPCFCTWKDNTNLTRGLGSNVQIQYCKILKMSPGAYIFQKLFLRGLSMEGNLCFKIDSASLIVLEVNVPFLLCFLCVWGQFSKCKPPAGLYLEGRFNRGFFALLVWGAYIWRDWFSDFTVCLRTQCHEIHPCVCGRRLDLFGISLLDISMFCQVEDPFDVTLVVQLSIDRLQMIETLCLHWEGKILKLWVARVVQ